MQENDNKRNDITKITGGITMSTQIEITHTFHAPRELVFKAFTESEHLQYWWGPKGWIFEVSKSNIRSGGVLLYSQKPTDGDEMWIKFEYSEIIAPEKIVYTNFFSDDEGNTVRAPFHPSWPLVTLNTITFIEEEGITTITMIVAPITTTEEEIRAIEELQEMVREGHTGTLVQLEEYLTKF
jgi:uncharacterized protein YndB with AHSA1/START domain